MKHSLLFPLTIISLSLASCSLISGTDDGLCKVDSDCSDSEICFFKEGSIGSCVAKSETPGVDDVAATTTSVPTQTENKTPNPVPKNNNPATPEDTIPPQTISTEDLTKELDTFVDDITKGL